ncbi:hypothetical protein GCM10009839_08350 [Catenulispora yoronensis]|uniref:PKD domain-containing protein n=1 Tax=Catenulispora yoronensis TaxID=450799 RepID=A0ABN2TP59_9ACTN
MAHSINRIRLAVSAVTASGTVFGVAAPVMAAPVAVAPMVAGVAAPTSPYLNGTLLWRSHPVAQGFPLDLTVAGGTVAAGKTLTYQVDFGEPGTPGNLQTLTPETPAALVTTHFRYTVLGQHTISVVTSDGSATSAPATKLVNIVAPRDAVAAFTLSPKTAAIPYGGTAFVTVDASASEPSVTASAIQDYSFDCGNGQTWTGGSTWAGCSYTQPGEYRISVSVTDDTGATATAPAQSVTITNAAPTPPDFSHMSYGPEWGATRTAFVDLGSVAFDPRVDPAKATFTIDWGDGTKQTITAANRNTVSGEVHRYDTAGTYTISVTANDGLGLPTSVAAISKQVTVTANFADPPTVSRAAGSDRYDTGVLLSRKFWYDANWFSGFSSDERHKAASVVLATGTAFPDALAGVPLADFVKGPLLLTDPQTLTPEVETEIKRILPAGATVQVLGGVKAVSPAVADRLTRLGYKVNRIAGADRYSTAIKIAHAMGDPALAVVARGDDFPDALTAGPMATALRTSLPGSGATKPSAVILSDNGTLTPETAAYLKSRLATAPSSQQDPTHLVAIGGGAAKAVRTLPGIDETPKTGNTLILVGTDRYDTARQVAEQFRDTSSKGLYYFSVGVATGTGYADALTGGTYLSEIGGGPLLLTDPTTESPATAAELTRFVDYTRTVVVFGGTKAVSAPVFSSIVARIHGIVTAF